MAEQGPNPQNVVGEQPVEGAQQVNPPIVVAAEPKRESRRNVRRRGDVDSAVEKVMERHFRDMSQIETHALKVEGQTLRDRVRTNVEERDAGNAETKPTGRKFYEQLRHMYEDQTAPPRDRFYVTGPPATAPPVLPP